MSLLWGLRILTGLLALAFAVETAWHWYWDLSPSVFVRVVAIWGAIIFALDCFGLPVTSGFDGRHKDTP